jgi:hypothetical protein
MHASHTHSCQQYLGKATVKNQIQPILAIEELFDHLRILSYHLI